ncbi:hypothetical protein [Chryseobacterium daeguense]|nr:hypothetical protein [Chryseobacterium daeguense]
MKDLIVASRASATRMPVARLQLNYKQYSEEKTPALRAGVTILK